MKMNQHSTAYDQYFKRIRYRNDDYHINSLLYPFQYNTVWHREPKLTKVLQRSVLQKYNKRSHVKYVEFKSSLKKTISSTNILWYGTFDVELAGVPCTIEVSTPGASCNIRINDALDPDHPNFPTYTGYRYFGSRYYDENNPKLMNIPLKFSYGNFIALTVMGPRILQEYSPEVIDYVNVTPEQHFQYMCTMEMYEVARYTYLLYKEIRDVLIVGNASVQKVVQIINKVLNETE